MTKATTITKEELQEIVYLREKFGLPFRKIAEKLGRDHTVVYRNYRKFRNSKYPNDIPGENLNFITRPKRFLDPPKVAPQTKAVVENKDSVAPPEVVEVEDVSLQVPNVELVPAHQMVDTVPRNVKMTDDEMADKLNMLVPKLLGMTEGETALLIDEMTGSQRVGAAAKLIDKMRLLRNQSTENISTNNFVTLISKLTAEIRGHNEFPDKEKG